MNHIDIIDEHSIIRETVGYEVLNQVPIEDMPKVMEFLKILYNYNRMKRVVEEEEELGWSDPMLDHLDREEKESEWQKRKRLEVLKEAKSKQEKYTRSLKELAKQKEIREEKKLIKKILADPWNADGFADSDPNKPKYRYEGYTYILNDKLDRIVGVEVPAAQVERHWLMEDLKEKDQMEEYYDDYIRLQTSGMFWEFHPTWTGVWEKDKYAFCHDRKFKKK